MGRPKRTDRHDDSDDEAQQLSDHAGRESARDETNETFEQPMFTDSAESPLYIPRDEWPEGLAFRWVRIEAGNAPDNTNWQKMTRVGWSPVARGKYKSLDRRFPVVPMPTGGDGGNESFIIFGGLCLCERDIRLVIQDKKRQEKATQDAGRVVETYVEGGNSNFPRFNQSQAPQFERGVRPVQFKD